MFVTNLSVTDRFRSLGPRFVVVHDPLEEPEGDTTRPPAWLPDCPYVVFPASDAPDEPIAAVLGAARLLRGHPLVVITGARSERHSGIGVFGTGWVSATEYRWVLRRAAAVLALTERDGTMQRASYEALELGLPIVCSATDVLRESLGDAATFCSNNARSIAAAVCAAASAPPPTAAAAAVRARLDNTVAEGIRAVQGLMTRPGSNHASAPPLVSIVIDNFNYARFLPRSIQSALNQTYQPLEVVVVDDGSTDTSHDVLDRYREHVTVLTRPNGGQGAALNTGFLASRGSVVLFLDADDELYPSAVERVVSCMAPDVAKVHFRLDTVDADGTPLGFTNPTRRARLASGDAGRLVLRAGRYVTPVMSGNAYPRWVLDTIMPIPEEEFRISADGYLVALAALHGRVVAIDEALGAYRVHGANAWACDGVDGARLRNLIRHDLARYQAIAATAGRRCHAPQVLGRRDQAHLRSRLASLRIEPHLHPVAGDTRARLVMAGVRTALTTTGMSPRQRLSFVAWFPIVGYGPRRIAVQAVTLLHTQQRRYSPTRRNTVGAIKRAADRFLA